MIESWLVLAVAICTDRMVDSDKAFDLFDRGHNPGRKKLNCRPYSKRETIWGLEEIMAVDEMKKAGLRWRAIGEHYGISDAAANERYKSAKRRHLK